MWQTHQLTFLGIGFIIDETPEAATMHVGQVGAGIDSHNRDIQSQTHCINLPPEP
jgi:hypothetical protein